MLRCEISLWIRWGGGGRGKYLVERSKACAVPLDSAYFSESLFESHAESDSAILCWEEGK